MPTALHFSRSTVVTSAVKAMIGVLEFILLRMYFVASNPFISGICKSIKIISYDIILMDLQMPEMNGFEATKYIRNNMNSKTPIIALTADVTTVDLEKCKAVGMNDYIAKPVDEKLLYSKIVGLVKKLDHEKNR